MKGQIDDTEDRPVPNPAERAGGGAPEKAGAGLDDFLCFAVYSANHAFNRAYQPLLEAVGLTYPQYLVMVSLWRADGQLVGELAGCLALESSTLTPLLKRLEAVGLVERRRSLADQRQVHVHLSEAGRALQRKAASVPLAVASATGLDRAAAEILRAELLRLRDTLRR